MTTATTLKPKTAVLTKDDRGNLRTGKISGKPFELRGHTYYIVAIKGEASVKRTARQIEAI